MKSAGSEENDEGWDGWERRVRGATRVYQGKQSKRAVLGFVWLGGTCSPLSGLHVPSSHTTPFILFAWVHSCGGRGSTLSSRGRCTPGGMKRMSAGRDGNDECWERGE